MGNNLFICFMLHGFNDLLQELPVISNRELSNLYFTEWQSMNGTLYNNTKKVKELEYTDLSDSEYEETLNVDDYHWSNLYSITKKEHQIPRQCVYFLDQSPILEESSLRIWTFCSCLENIAGNLLLRPRMQFQTHCGLPTDLSFSSCSSKRKIDRLVEK